MPEKQKIALKLRALNPQGDYLGGTVDTELKRLRLSHRLNVCAAAPLASASSSPPKTPAGKVKEAPRRRSGSRSTFGRGDRRISVPRHGWRRRVGNRRGAV